MRHFSRLCVLTLPLIATAAAGATSIAAGGSANAAPVVSSGSVVAQYSNVAFTSQAPAGMASTFSGTYNAVVYRDFANSLCGSAGNCLSFALQVTNSASSTDNLLRVTTGPFTSAFTYNVGYQATVSGIVPDTIQDSLYGTLAFVFSPTGSVAGIAPGSTSDVLVMQSSATNYQAASASWIGMQSATVAAFAPATAVTPEPSSLMLLGSGLLSVAGMARKRFA